jgi:predicted anti-sigma-YlaC factor YlaD
MKCSAIRKNLSAFFDNELSIEARNQIEKHLSECVDCQSELERLREVANQFRGLSISKVLPQQWDETRRKLMTNIDGLPHKARWFRLPIFIPVGTFVVLLVLVGIFMFSGNNDSSLMSIDVCLHEHSIFTSEQGVPPEILSDFAITDNGQTSDDSDSNENTSDIDMLMEAHYGFN